MNKMIIVIAGFFLLFAPLQASLAKAGCCSAHGGVASCDTVTGIQVCKDGSKASTSCVCHKVKENKQGCCSGHGGIAKCDVKTGKHVCKDGTPSSCACPTGAH